VNEEKGSDVQSMRKMRGMRSIDCDLPIVVVLSGVVVEVASAESLKRRIETRIGMGTCTRWQ
jgi:hypothetical protein